MADKRNTRRNHTNVSECRIDLATTKTINNVAETVEFEEDTMTPNDKTNEKKRMIYILLDPQKDSKEAKITLKKLSQDVEALSKDVKEVKSVVIAHSKRILALETTTDSHKKKLDEIETKDNVHNKRQDAEIIHLRNEILAQ
ncbi:unnamed protein product [Allacma fusca]|uniref:Uncharacterized protein n=1 Tax=Allacma fusca TaxID=39272 RepID=A0A8J2PMV3_9HEXA|nr:unnamed protein product [Allacma fusca]